MARLVGAVGDAVSLRLVPLTQRAVAAWVAEHHRHLPPVRGDVIRVGVADGATLVGVIQAGRPVARLLDDGATLEVTRCAIVDGAPRNVASKLYGAIWRAARSLGWGAHGDLHPRRRGRRVTARGRVALRRRGRRGRVEPTEQGRRRAADRQAALVGAVIR